MITKVKVNKVGNEVEMVAIGIDTEAMPSSNEYYYHYYTHPR